MMEFTFFLILCVIFFAVMGYLRGFYKEFVGFISILLTLFIMIRFFWILDLFIGGISAGARYIVEALFLIVMTFFAYQQAPTTFAPSYYSRGLPGVDSWQTRILGALLGGFNGYLVIGSLWYMMDQLEYPLHPLFAQPLVGSASADFVGNLPMVWLQQGNLILWIVFILAWVIFLSR
jgi:hypothetical protein